MEFDRRVFLTFGALSVAAIAADTGSLPEAPFGTEKGWIPLLNGRDLSGWRFDPGADKVASGTGEWFTATSVFWSPEAPERLAAVGASGPIIVNGLTNRTMNLVTERKFGDFELYLEFLLAKKSNSGVYHHGLYEVQVFDSYGSTAPLTFSDAGGIYQRWANGKGFGGNAPARNAARPPGQWQYFRTRFRAPDASGARKQPPERVNATARQANVATTRSAMTIPANPLMLRAMRTSRISKPLFPPLSNEC
jgi:hypothetical protein